MVKVLQQPRNVWINAKKFLKSCVRAEAEQDNINHPAYGTWTADFMLRQNESRAFLGNLNDPRVPWRHWHKRREMMAIAGIISQMACKNQTAIRCGLQIMQKGTRATRGEH